MVNRLSLVFIFILLLNIHKLQESQNSELSQLIEGMKETEIGEILSDLIEYEKTLLNVEEEKIGIFLNSVNMELEDNYNKLNDLSLDMKAYCFSKEKELDAKEKSLEAQILQITLDLESMNRDVSKGEESYSKQDQSMNEYIEEIKKLREEISEEKEKTISREKSLEETLQNFKECIELIDSLIQKGENNFSEMSFLETVNKLKDLNKFLEKKGEEKNVAFISTYMKKMNNDGPNFKSISKINELIMSMFENLKKQKEDFHENKDIILNKMLKNLEIKKESLQASKKSKSTLETLVKSLKNRISNNFEVKKQLMKYKDIVKIFRDEEYKTCKEIYNTPKSEEFMSFINKELKSLQTERDFTIDLGAKLSKIE
jgi:hypothetical protein